MVSGIVMIVVMVVIAGLLIGVAVIVVTTIDSGRLFFGDLSKKFLGLFFCHGKYP
ncbi:hypothetical protein L8106_17977 [Lyngbya sp. PCC 8106]|nr:hypothetical protein L8106_17977 [Lyngbya sp. PCC 8106]